MRREMEDHGVFSRFGRIALIPVLIFATACGPKETKTEIKNSAGYTATEVQESETDLVTIGVKFTPMQIADEDGSSATIYLLDESFHANNYVESGDHEGLIAHYIEVLKRAAANPAVSNAQRQVYSEKLDAAEEYQDALLYGVQW